MHLFKRLWIRRLRRIRDEYQSVQDDISHNKKILHILALSLSGYLCCAIGFGAYWSFSSAPLAVKPAIQEVLQQQHLSYSANLPAGVVTTASVIAIADSLLDKSGGYIGNDRLPPGVWLDNMPHWELGVLLQVRDMTKVLSTSFSQASASVIGDEDLQKAEARFNYDNNSWLFPATESQYRAGTAHLKKYLLRLAQPANASTYFYADAAHLNDYLAGVEQRLKNLSQRLNASVGPDINTDSAALPVTQVSANGLYNKTPWTQLDDIFFEARGSSWALIALLQAVEMDFSPVLKQKNAQQRFAQIIRELEATQKNIYSPMILNGNGFGFLVNHSLLMASYLSRAQLAIADCRHLLLKPSVASAL
ncbi:MAG TPA: DUF2333 family protein [Cellvibrio sp.]|nr:DUF2333 family protein [Cellvibrio sp.]